MQFTSIGDLATDLILKKSRLTAQRDINRLSKELTTGLTQNVPAALRSDYSALSSWERSIGQGETRLKTLSEQRAAARMKSDILDASRSDVLALANDIVTVSASNQNDRRVQLANDARGYLETFISRLNSRNGQQSVFAGTATDSTAVASSSTILASARTALSGAVTVSDALARLDSWMNDAVAGFPADVYLGAPVNAQTVRLDETTTIEIPGRADDDGIKNAIRQLVTVALTTDASLGFSTHMQAGLLQSAATGLRTAEGSLTEIQASVGHTEARIESAMAQTQANVSSARQLKLAALQIDPYETASRLQNTELQLEKIYALTARSARMSLMEYLK